MAESWKQKAYEKALAGEWAKYTSLRHEDDCMCAGGMIAWAVCGDPTEMYSRGNVKVQGALREFITSTGIFSPDYEGMPYWDVAEWNDSAATTLEDVQSAFKRLVEAEGTQ